MGYESVLKLSLIPTISLLLLSFVSIVLTTHYWILGDWIMGRWIPVPSQFNEKAKFPIDDVIVDYTEPSTNATIISGCLNLTAAVMALISYKKLKSRDMDTDFNTPLRRFYVVAVIITGIGGTFAALSSVILHFTDKGPDQYGCTTTTGKTTNSGVPFTNLLCSREMGACNFVKPKLKGKDKEWAANLGCNEIVAVKWLQIVLLINAIIVMAMFATQAKQRKKTRWSRQSFKEPLQNSM